MSQENVEIVRLAYAAFSEGDLDALAELKSFDSQPPTRRRSRDSGLGACVKKTSAARVTVD
jgi:ketosteroid isomerase-like protein